MKTKSETILQMKNEIVQLVLSCRVPVDVESFGELHDYIDANCLGDFCDDAYSEQMLLHFGGCQDECMPQGLVDFINECQSEIDAWLRDGRLEGYMGDQPDISVGAVAPLLRSHKALSHAMDKLLCELRGGRAVPAKVFDEAFEVWSDNR